MTNHNELPKKVRRVANILRDHVKARNNNGTLLAYYIRLYNPTCIDKDAEGVPHIKLNKLQNLDSIESIIRARRIVQNHHGLYLPTDPKVRKARRIKELNYTNAEVREANNLDLRKPYVD